MRTQIAIICVILFASIGLTGLKGQSRQNNNNKSGSFNKVFAGEPGKAALYSLILPGAGQVYNKSYWKVPLVIAGEAYMLNNLSNKISSFRRLNDCHIALSNNEIDPLICDGQTNVSTAFSRSQSARSQKEMAWIFMGAAHMLNVLDAFIHRHLINFDTSDDISLQLNDRTLQLSLIHI